MRAWWNGRTLRERRLLLAAGASLTALFLYFPVWEPLHHRHDRLRAALDRQRAELEWVRERARAAEDLRNTLSRQPIAVGESLLWVVERTARELSLSQSIRRVEPQDQERVQLWLESAPFAELAQWLRILERQYGVAVRRIALQHEQTQGLVRANLSLQRPLEGS